MKRILLLLVFFLGTIAAIQAQEALGPWVMSAEMTLGAGAGSGPQAYSSATNSIGSYVGSYRSLRQSVIALHLL